MTASAFPGERAMPPTARRSTVQRRRDVQRRHGRSARWRCDRAVESALAAAYDCGGIPRLGFDLRLLHAFAALVEQAEIELHVNAPGRGGAVEPAR